MVSSAGGGDAVKFPRPSLSTKSTTSATQPFFGGSLETFFCLSGSISNTSDMI